MKKIKLIPWWPVALFIFAVIMQNCNPKDDKKPPVVPPVVKVDTTKHLPDVVLENPEMDNYSNEVNARRKPPRPKPHPNDPPLPPVTPLNGCLLLDFNGHFVSGTLWNTNGAFTCAPSGLNATGEQDVLNRVTAYYSVFNPYINITTSETVFNSYPQNKRRRIIITSTMPSGFQNSGGVAYVNSFSWFDDSPAFVNSAGLGYNTKNISDATSHEGGHTLGCRHQSSYDVNCVKTSEYFWGNKIMGASYSDPNPQWSIGQSSLGCLIIQNDTLIIFATLRK